MTRVLLVHGAATSAAVWDRLLPHLDGVEVVAVDRPRTGSLDQEVAWLATLAEDSWVVGLSGGATLGLAVAASGVRLRGAVLHEPAVGSLVPGLLAPMVSAFSRGGTTAFARRLYGPAWAGASEVARPDAPRPDAPWLDDDVTRRELAMFRSFEPAPPSPAAGRVVTTVGELSPAVRHQAAAALTSYGVQTATVPGARHFAPWEKPAEYSAVLHRILRHT